MRTYFFLFAILLFFIGCKSDEKSNTKSTLKVENQVPSGYILSNQKEICPLEIEQMRKAASEVLAYRKKESGNKSYTVMDLDIWKFGGLVSDIRTLFGDSLNGSWMDFKENLTYDYGQYDQKSGSGHYFYDFEKATLILLDDNPAIKPQEFEVKMNNDMLVIIGMLSYKDNNMQAKLDRVKEFPVKPQPSVPAN